MKRQYEKIGLVYPKSVDRFLREFGMLDINPKDKRYFDVFFDAVEAIGCNLDGEFFEKCLEEYDIHDPVYPVGEACRKNLLVLMTEKETFYCYTNGLLLLLGDSVDEMLDCIVGECREPVEID